MQRVTKLESLSNELFIECFDYLTTLDVFYSFYRLNYRFGRLIQNIPLKLDFENSQKTRFDRFCSTILLNPEIKKQIYSLKLSNIDTCGQIQSFLSYFSLDEFLSLRSLTLIGIDMNNFEALKSMLALLSKSCSIHIIDPDAELKGEQSVEQTDRYPRNKEKFKSQAPCIFQLSSITAVTLSRCTCRDLSQLFEHLTLLKYANVKKISSDREKTWTNYYQTFSNQHAIHLKQLIMTDFRGNFGSFEMLSKQTPNLKYLLISFEHSVYMINESRLGNLITTSFPLLTLFKSELLYYCAYSKNETLSSNKVEQLHRNFWKKQHHWHTEYRFHWNPASTYTISYILNTVTYDYVPNKSQVFDHITDLTVSLDSLTESCRYQLNNVQTLRLKNPYSHWYTDSNDLSAKRKQFESLKMIVNLSNLQYLDLEEVYNMNVSFLLLEILKQASKLSSLKLYWRNLKLLTANHESWQYLNKMIKKLYVNEIYNFKLKEHFREKFCEIFSNLEQFSCRIIESDDLFFLLNRLTKLSMIKILFESYYLPKDLSSFEEKAKKLNLLYHNETIERYDRDDEQFYSTVVTIWIGDNIK